jgi:hypothetical protein
LMATPNMALRIAGPLPAEKTPAIALTPPPARSFGRSGCKGHSVLRHCWQVGTCTRQRDGHDIRVQGGRPLRDRGPQRERGGMPGQPGGLRWAALPADGGESVLHREWRVTKRGGQSWRHGQPVIDARAPARFAGKHPAMRAAKAPAIGPAMRPAKGPTQGATKCPDKRPANNPTRQATRSPTRFGAQGGLHHRESQTANGSSSETLPEVSGDPLRSDRQEWPVFLAKTQARACRVPSRVRRRHGGRVTAKGINLGGRVGADRKFALLGKAWHLTLLIR